LKARRFANSSIVLGTEVNGIAVIRSLGRLGVRCGAVFMPSRGDHARHSRYLALVREVPRDASDTVLVSVIRDVADRIGQGPQVLIPTTDRYAEFLSRNFEVLANDFIPCCPDKELCDAFLDKWKTARICADNGILIPQTACPQTLDELAKVAGDIAFPVVVKPRYTFGTNFPGKNAVFADARGLLQFFHRNDLLGSCVIQQIIPSGDGDILVTASFSGSNGTVEAIYSGRKIRQYLPDYGATCFGISERYPALETQSRGFLDGISYKGFAALEFARSRDDGQAYFLELNTRTYYHNQLFADAGIDLTQVAYLSATGHDFKTVLGALKQREGIIWLDFRRDLQSMRIKRRKGRITVTQWLRSIVAARSFAYWDWRDPAPFVRACLWRAKDLAFNLWKRRSRRKAD
jgi:predicted ATP-grasp superfamily ATP-dependent carboligase